MKLGKIEKFVLLYLYSKSPHEDWGEHIRGVKNKTVYGRVDRTQLIFQFYQTKNGDFSKNYKAIVKWAIPEDDYAKLQSTFSRALGRLREKGLVVYEKPFGRQSNRTLTERRISVDVTEEGRIEMLRLVRYARRKLGLADASMTRQQIGEFLELLKDG